VNLLERLIVWLLELLTTTTYEVVKREQSSTMDIILTIKTSKGPVFQVRGWKDYWDYYPSAVRVSPDMGRMFGRMALRHEWDQKAKRGVK
jgi:hypothetical protein